MKNILSKAVVILGVATAAFQQGAWYVNGYYETATTGQVICSLVWSLTIVGMSVLLALSLKKD